MLVGGASAGLLSFGQCLDADVPAGDYPVEVQLGGTPVVGPADIPVAAQNNTLVFVVGNIAPGRTPVVPLIGDLALSECETGGRPDRPGPRDESARAGTATTGHAGEPRPAPQRRSPSPADRIQRHTAHALRHGGPPHGAGLRRVRRPRSGDLAGAGVEVDHQRAVAECQRQEPTQVADVAPRALEPVVVGQTRRGAVDTQAASGAELDLALRR